MTPGILHDEGRTLFRCHFFKCGMVQRHRRRLSWERYRDSLQESLYGQIQIGPTHVTNATTPAISTISISISMSMTIITPCNASASEITAPIGSVTASAPSGMTVPRCRLYLQLGQCRRPSVPSSPPADGKTSAPAAEHNMSDMTAAPVITLIISGPSFNKPGRPMPHRMAKALHSSYLGIGGTH